MSSRLATVERIDEIREHPNADALEIAIVKGWQCVVGKGDFKAGDGCVYILIDTIVPETDDFAFMERVNYRVRTMKLRGIYSQGLVMPVDILRDKLASFDIGDDVTEAIGVEKYVKPIPPELFGSVIKPFPTEILSITDEDQLQNFPGLLDRIKGKEIYVTQKCDGTSGSFIRFRGEKMVCGRNYVFAEDDKNTHWQMYRKYDMGVTVPQGYSIQFEVVGPGIQKNPMGLDEVEIRVFNVFYMNGDGYMSGRTLLGLEEMTEFCRKGKLPMAKVLSGGPFESIQEWVDFADSQTYDNGKPAEGTVVRLAEPEYEESIGKPLSFKVISPKYAVKHGE